MEKIRYYAVQWDEIENRSKIVPWADGIGNYVDADSVQHGTAEKLSFTEAKHRLLAEKRDHLYRLRGEITALRSLHKGDFDAKWQADAELMERYRVQVAAQEAAEQEKTAKYEADLAAYVATVDGYEDYSAWQQMMVRSLVRRGLHVKGWSVDPTGLLRTVLYEAGGVTAKAAEGGHGWNVFSPQGSAASLQGFNKVVSWVKGLVAKPEE
jgi:hypothetical protein